jgi:threonine dehydrogenase-like Zn-dependent dehydrogenase
MKQVFATGGRVVVAEVPEPTLGPGEVLVAPAFSVISTGTETHAIRSTANPETTGNETYPALRPSSAPAFRTRSAGTRWSGPVPRPPRPDLIRIGYSLAGTVLAVGADVADLRPGDQVACSGNQCAVHAERVAVPRSLVARVPPGVGLDEAAFVTLGSIALNAVRRSGCQLGEVVGVYGLGPIGLLAVQIARAAGLDVLGLDVANRRVELARELGATAAINPDETDPFPVVFDLTDGFGLDAVLLCVATPSSEPLNRAFDLCRQRGRVVGVGLFGMDVSRDRMYAHDVILYPALAYGPGRYDPVYEEGNVDYPIGLERWTENRNQAAFLRLLATKQVRVGRLAPIWVPLAEAPRAYELLFSADRPPTAILTYPAV